MDLHPFSKRKCTAAQSDTSVRNKKRVSASNSVGSQTGANSGGKLSDQPIKSASVDRSVSDQLKSKAAEIQRLADQMRQKERQSAADSQKIQSLEGKLKRKEAELTESKSLQNRYSLLYNSEVAKLVSAEERIRRKDEQIWKNDGTLAKNRTEIGKLRGDDQSLRNDLQVKTIENQSIKTQLQQQQRITADLKEKGDLHDANVKLTEAKSLETLYQQEFAKMESFQKRFDREKKLESAKDQDELLTAKSGEIFQLRLTIESLRDANFSLETRLKQQQTGVINLLSDEDD